MRIGDLKAAVEAQDAAAVRALLESDSGLRAHLNDPWPGAAFGETALFAAVQRSDEATIAALLEAGADINRRTEWWAGGFGVLDECSPELAPWLIARGARLTPHAAARLGLIAELEARLDADPEAVHARGGDGQTPLHFASSVEVAGLLLARGADLNARDVDHESTPAQYMLRVEHRRHYPRDRQDVARFLVDRGCQTDILMAAALGDPALVTRLLDAEPGVIAMEVSERWFPKRDPRAGGTIYIWQLGRYRTAHTVARDFGHEDVYALLLARTPQALKLALACELGDETAFRQFMARKPVIGPELAHKLPDAAQSNNTAAVRLMLEAGWPVDTPGDMGATALHWAAFNGNAAMARAILQHAPSLEQLSRTYPGTPLSWAVFGSGNGWRRQNTDYAGVVEALLTAGARVPPGAEALQPSPAVAALLAPRGEHPTSS